MNNPIKYKRIAITGAILLHIGLFVLLILLGFKTQLPLPEEEGILMDFGITNTPSASSSTPSASASQNQAKQEYLTQPDEETPYMEELKKQQQEEKKRQQEEKRERERQKKKQQQTHNLIENALKESANSQNNIETNGQGSSNQMGAGAFSQGISYSLDGRIAKQLPKPMYTPNEEGKVVVEIHVDNQGKVIHTIAGKRGTTTTNNQLWQAAEQAAQKAKFNANLQAPNKQVGYITYYFQLR